MLAQIVTTILGFFLLVVFLKKFFWRTILGILDERRAHIEADLTQAATQKADMVKLQDELSQRLATLDGEARARIQEAIQEGRRIASEIQEDARAQARGIVEKAKETIELELAKAKVGLRDDLADMTIEAVEDVLRQKLTADADRALIGRILDELTQAAEPRR